MSTEKETTPQANLGAPITALVRAAAAFVYEITKTLKDEDDEAAQVLASMFIDDPAAEVVISVQLAPAIGVVQTIVVNGIRRVVYASGVVEVEGIRH